MKIAQIASLAHKWLALVLGAQLLLWIVSGFFFTLYPIERVRSEDRVRPIVAAGVETANVAAAPEWLAQLERPPTKLTFEMRPEGPVALAEFAQGRPVLFDAASGQRLSPLSANAAIAIARARITGGDAPTRAQYVTGASPEYRGPLPAWRVSFEDAEHLAVYISADTGQVTARRSDLWRVYDALWALHIMDWRDHENFNHGLIIAAAFGSLIAAISGIALIPYRFRWRRTRKAPA